MELLNKNITINFVAQRKPAAIISSFVVLISIIALLTQGLNFGIDFTGGTLVEVAYTEPAQLDQVRNSLAQSEFSDAIVQYFGSATDVLIRIPPHEHMESADISSNVLQALERGGLEVEMRRVEFVGPQVGDELTEDGGLAMLYALLCILIYVAIRFQLKFSAGAIVALLHDVLIVLGFFALTQFQFDLSVLAAMLAVIGYSLNDTIVVFDRIRENFHKMRKSDSAEVINISLNQTLSRTLMTSITTLLVLVSLLVLGGESIHSFSIALIVGVLIGTYSSLYVASPMTLWLGISRDDLIAIQVEKEGAEFDKLP